MTIMPVEPINMTASYGGWSTAVGLLREQAAELGLQLVGWVAVPIDSPKIKIEADEDGDPFWTCPHCGEKQTELELVEQGDCCLLAQPNYEEKIRTTYGISETLKTAWTAASDLVETDTIGYYCLNCNGWVSPEDEVIWS